MEMPKNKAVLAAEQDGCAPIWCDGILGWEWHCTCDDNRHWCDSQCSAIVPKSKSITGRIRATD